MRALMLLHGVRWAPSRHCRPSSSWNDHTSRPSGGPQRIRVRSVLMRAAKIVEQGPFPAPPRSRDALAELVEPHRRRLLNHCYRMLGSWTEAEDVFQDVLVRAWRGLEGYRGQAALRTWLYQIATNACLTALKSRMRRSLPELEAPAAGVDRVVGAPGDPAPWLEPAPSVFAGHDLEGSVARRESVALAFVAALQHLPPRQRAVLLLFEVLGYEATEIASMLEMTVTAVNSAL